MSGSNVGRVAPALAFAAIVATLVAVRLTRDDAAEPAAPRDRSAVAMTKLRFVDVTERAGLAEPHSHADLTGESAMTAGAAVADVDRDGDLDIYLTRVGLPNRLLVNDGNGAFVDRAAAAGVEGPDGGSSAAAFGDIDGDGDADLVVTPAGDASPAVYLSNGDGTFADATATSGVTDLPALGDGALAQAHGLTLSDFDRDGDLDLLMTHWDAQVPAALADAGPNDIEPDADGRTVCPRARWLAARGFPRAADAPANRARLYRNDGAGRLSDATADLGLPFAQIMGFTGRFADVDGDGWDDLLVTGDFCTSRVFRNVEGQRFEDITEASRAATDENGMGSVLTDLNGDGIIDWFVTGIGPVVDAPAPLQLGGFGSSGNRAYLGTGDGTFRDATDELGVRNGGWAWGAAFADFANDGVPELVMTNGYSIGADDTAASADDPIVVWERDGSSTRPAREVARAAGIRDTGLGRALVAFDADDDGDLDLLVANFGAEPVLYRNDTEAAHWLTVRLDDPMTAGNRSGLGARVRVITASGTTTRWLIAGGSYESQEPAEIHVGLGVQERFDEIEVTWPGATEPQIVRAGAADRTIVVTRTPTGP